MKIIKIVQENINDIELVDDDNTNIDEYTNELKNIFNSSEIMILETTSANVILRPHKINSIIVINDESNDKKNIDEYDDKIQDIKNEQNIDINIENNIEEINENNRNNNNAINEINNYDKNEQ